MKYLRKFTTSEEYNQFLEGKEYVEPYVAVISNGEVDDTGDLKKEVIYKALPPKSLFPFYITTTYRKEYYGQWLISYNHYWDATLDSTELYDTLFNALEPNEAQIFQVPDEFLLEHPIYVDGHQIIYVSTERNDLVYGDILHFMTIDEWPLSEINFNDYSMWIQPNSVSLYVGESEI